MKKDEISKGLSKSDLAGSGKFGVNDAGTCGKGDTPLTQVRSPGVHGCVYFIRAGDKIKIGYSARPLDRLRQLQTSHPDKLEILGTMPGSTVLEYGLHAQFKKLHIRGEWFSAGADLLRFIEISTDEGRAAAKARVKEARRRPGVKVTPEMRDLMALRFKHGADSPTGNRCSNLIAQLGNMQLVEGEYREALAGYMANQAVQLNRLLAIP